MFVRKLVQKASLMKSGGQFDGLRPEDLNPHTVFHYGIPAGSFKFAYDSVQNILAVSTRNGQIKLFGCMNTQLLLESEETVPSKFLQFIENRGILLNVTENNHIEVWDIDGKILSHVQVLKEEITSFTVLHQTLYMYVGDSSGNISVLKLDPEACCLARMKYSIPFCATRGQAFDASEGSAIVQVLPQPLSESNRILIVFKDGLATLWNVQESKAILSVAKSYLQSSKETKEVTSACWACPFGSKAVFGYSNGELSMWDIPPSSSIGEKSISPQDKVPVLTAPICKLNLGYKTEKNSIASLKWSNGKGKCSKLFVIGASDAYYSNPPQVLLLNEYTKSRMTKLGLHLPEACLDLEIISNSAEQNKPRQEYLLLLGKSGHVYVYDNYAVEKYLVQSQLKSPPSLPSEIVLKLPFGDSVITAAKMITNKRCVPDSKDEALNFLSKNIEHFLPIEISMKDGSHNSSTHFDGFAKIQNLYITGHSNGVINFWDVSCPFLLPLVSLKQQNVNSTGNDTAVTALYYDGSSGLLVSGDQSGTINIFNFKPEPFSTDNSLLSLQGNIKKGGSHIVQSLKLLKITGAAICINKCHISNHFAIGSDKGYVSVIDLEGPTFIYEKHIPSDICSGIISLQFERCNFHGFEKNVMVVATKDSSVLAIDSDSGNELCTNPIRPNRPSKALFMRILDGHGTNESRINVDGLMTQETLENVEQKPPTVLLCSEKAVYVYSLSHIMEGVRKVIYKKKFNSSSCCWASTFSSLNDEGLILFHSSGKYEIRSLPTLSLLKKTYIRGFTVPASKPNVGLSGSICSSREGDLVVVRGDQGIHFLSTLHDTRTYRYLQSVSQVYQKHIPQRPVVDAAIQKEKKKGIFSSVLKVPGSKARHVPESDAENSKETLDKLERTFCIANFQSDSVNADGGDGENVELLINIDDIDLDDIMEKPKGQNKSPALNTEKLASKFQVFRGKLKSMKVKNDKSPTKEEPQDEKNGALDEIKKKYGFASSSESGIGAAQNKLSENIKKFQGINQQTTDMNDIARSFSWMAREVLRVEQCKQ